MSRFDNIQILKQSKVFVQKLLDSPAKLKKQTGDIGLKNNITDKNLYRPQLALAGYVGLFNYRQVQIFGNTEYFYLNSLTKKKRLEAFKTITQFPIPCIVLTNNHQLDDDLLNIAIDNNIAILNTSYDTTKASFLLSEYLDDWFAPQAVVHGSFVDVYGVGMLIVGRPSIGKSEIALDLVERGHRLVADDVVMLTKKRESTLMGTGTTIAKHFMEIRGLGIIDIRQNFGVRSVRFQKRLEIIVELTDWDSSDEYSRLGLDEELTDLMGVEISTVKLPIFPGKNITVIAEVIAMNYLLKTYGYNPAQVFSDNLTEQMKKNQSIESQFNDQRYITFFQADEE